MNFRLRGAAANTVWLLVDRATKMLLGILVGAWVARHLGPHHFGELAFVLAFATIFQTVAQLGLDSIVVRDIAQQPDRAHKLLGVTFGARFAAGCVCWMAAVGGILLLRPEDPRLHVMTAIVAAGCLFQAVDAVDIWFQSQTQSHLGVKAKLMAYGVTAAAKIGLILSGAGLEWFAGVTALEFALNALALVFAYRFHPTGRPWKWDRSVAFKLAAEAYPVTLAGIAVILYLRVDQLMLGELLGPSALGTYSAVVPLSTAFYFLPVAICASAAPELARLKQHDEAQYQMALDRLFSLMWWCALPLSIGLAVSARWLVGLLFGHTYLAGADVLSIHAFSIVFVALGVAQSQWIAIEKKSPISLYKTLIGLLFSVVLNYLAIPRWGVEGAAAATVASFAISAVFANAILAPQILWRQLRSIAILPFPLVLK